MQTVQMDDQPATEVIKTLSAYQIAEVAGDLTNKRLKVIRPKLSLQASRSAKDNPFNSPINPADVLGRVILSTTASDDHTNVVVTNLNKKTKLLSTAFGRDPDELDELEDERDKPLVDEEEEPYRMSCSKEEMLYLIGLFKSELHNRDIAMTAIKCEQLKRLLNPIEMSRSSMAEAYLKLQDRLKENQNKDGNNNTSKENSDSADSKRENALDDLEEANQKPTSSKSLSSASAPAPQLATSPNDEQNEKNLQKNEDSDSLDILNILLELLDRHPLLALPRDTLYCVDYKFDEQSTRNYLNLKIKNLDGLIKQHRDYRLFMNKRLRECEQSLFNISKELEVEKRLRVERVEDILRRKERTILLKNLEEVQEALEEEKRTKLMIVLTLLAELNEERDKIQILSETIEDSRLENAQLKETNAKDKLDLENQIKDLTVENSMLKLKLERRGSTTSVVKPAVPAKPAQLLNQKRNSTTPKSQ